MMHGIADVVVKAPADQRKNATGAKCVGFIFRIAEQNEPYDLTGSQLVLLPRRMFVQWTARDDFCCGKGGQHCVAHRTVIITHNFQRRDAWAFRAL
ncbi:hypothetical protein ASE85_03395 [Sphingobium sp. Leaf26]|nr:hypothetical protein ASE85_03395 [Sphingobium sp. Leaf26]